MTPTADSLRSSLPFLLRILAALLLVALVPLLWASWRLISVNRESMETQVKATQTVAVRTASDAFRAFVATRRSLARSIAQSPILGTGDAEAVSSLLQGSLQAWAELDIEAVGLFDPAGGLLLGARSAGSELDLPRWWRTLGERDVALEVDGDRIVLLVREPLEQGGSALVVGGTDGLRQPLRPSQLIDDSQAHIAVLDRRGEVIAGSLGEDRAPEALLDLALSRAVEGAGIYRTGDHETLAAYSPIATTPWTVVALQPRSVAEQVAVRMRRRAAAALAIAGMLVAVLVLLAYRSLVRPLRELLLAQRRLAKSRSRLSGGNLVQQLRLSFEELERRLEDQEDLGQVFLGRYQVLELVGRGGMGTVFRGWDPQLERYVALKTVRFDKVAKGESNLVDVLLREARTTAQMQHAHIVQVFDVASTSDAAFIAMEFVDGISLEAWIHRGLPAPDEVIPVALATAEGIRAAHDHGILHRDIKSGNVLLGFDGSIKVTDFGLAKMVSAQAEQQEVVFGTPGHIAPEVLLGRKLDKPSDLFALGIVLHYALTGYTPFRGADVKETLRRTLDGKVQRPSRLRPVIPAELEDLMLELLANNPAERPTAEVTAERLRAMQVERGITWQPPPRRTDDSYVPEASAEFVETWISG